VKGKHKQERGGGRNASSLLAEALNGAAITSGGKKRLTVEPVGEKIGNLLKME